MFDANNFVTAHFCNEQRNLVEVLYENDNKIFSFYVNVDVEDNFFKNLIQICSINQIEKNTLDKIKADTEAVVAFQRKLVERGDALFPRDTDITIDDLLEFVYNFNSEKTGFSEMLFRFKLQAFEIPAVDRSSEQVKEQIRTAANPMELIGLVKSAMDNYQP